MGLLFTDEAGLMGFFQTSQCSVLLLLVWLIDSWIVLPGLQRYEDNH